MKLEYKLGKLSFNFHDLLEHIPAEEKRDLAEAIACDSDVIDFVTQQIITGWTENSSHGYRGGANVTHATGLDKAWRDVAKASGEVAKREIERLEAALAKECEHTRQLSLTIQTMTYARQA